MTMQEKYERVCNGMGAGEQPKTLRLRVPGGWIYYLAPMYQEPCAVFVPDAGELTMLPSGAIVAKTK